MSVCCFTETRFALAPVQEQYARDPSMLNYLCIWHNKATEIVTGTFSGKKFLKEKN